MATQQTPDPLWANHKRLIITIISVLAAILVLVLILALSGALSDPVGTPTKVPWYIMLNVPEKGFWLGCGITTTPLGDPTLGLSISLGRDPPVVLVATNQITTINDGIIIIEYDRAAVFRQPFTEAGKILINVGAGDMTIMRDDDAEIYRMGFKSTNFEYLLK